MVHETQSEPAGHVGIGGKYPRLQGRARVDDRDSQGVPARGQLQQYRSVRADLSVNHAVSHQLADNESRV